MSRPSSTAQDPPEAAASAAAANPHPAARSTRSQHSPWQGPSSSRSSSRRGLAPISTGGAVNTRPGSSLDERSPSRGALSPLGPTPYPSNSIANRQVASRQSSTSSTSSLISPPGFSNFATGALHAGHRSRAVTGSGSPRLSQSITSLSSLSQAVNSGPSAVSASASRFAKHSPSLSGSVVGSPVSSTAGSSSGQLTSLVITQLNILLSTIKESNFDTQSDKIRRLVDEHGMEVFTTYFRRLLQSSASTIFPNSARPSGASDNAGSYQMLAQEMQKITTEAVQADKIAQSLDTTEGELFRDFDLATFVEHFRLDPIARVALAASCRVTVKQDLRSKADSLLSASFQTFLSSVATPQNSNPPSPQDDVSPSVLASIIEKLNQDPPRNWGEEQRENLKYAVRVRYRNLSARIPPAVESAMFLNELLDSQESRLARTIQRTGPRATSSLEACKELLSTVETRDISYLQIANALLFMVIAQDGDVYDPTVFVDGVRQHRAGTKIDWTDVVQGFDKEQLRITKKQFLGIYNALLPLAQEYANFDIQSLWSGQWQYAEAQLNFVVAFLSTTREELDVSQIPNLRQAFTLTDYEDATQSVKDFAVEAIKHPLVSRDATQALFTMIFRSPETYGVAQMLGIPETLINPNMTIFLVAASAVPKPWQALQDQALKQLFYPFLLKQHDNYDFVMHSLWLNDKSWVATRIVDFYQADPLLLPLIYEHAVEHQWLELLLTVNSTFVVDLATYAHGKGQCDLVKWADPNITAMGPTIFAKAVMDFIRMKVDDEQAFRAETEQRSPRTTTPLDVKTVHTLCSLVADILNDEDLGGLWRQCLQAYPRLFNYGEIAARDTIIEANSASGHALPEAVTQQMEIKYKSMYGGASSPDQVITELRRLKVSEDPADQELFASMLQGLFEEYNCFGEYPNEALATTAVLFGGVIQFNVLSGVAEQAALHMVFEAVSEYGPDDPMYRFGLQAMIHLLGRLKEWPHVAERILHTPSLKGTQVIPAAENALKELAQESGGTVNGDGVNGIANGALEDEYEEDAAPSVFSSVHVDPPLRPELYEEPNDEVSDKVMFVLNNVSKRNLEEKFKDLEGTLEDKHHQWFAHYLVEELARSQPNFQGLYLQLLETFDKNVLWAEVLRETYASCAKMLNAQSTMDSTTERTNLKNLANWLGSLTLARNQPILHRNISFRDLLLEGHDTQRLLVAIPFTCKVLVHAAESKVFRPPNPWIMELLGLLSELYHCFELKLNLKFEIEVMCKDLSMDIKTIDPLDIIRSRPLLQENNMLQQYVPEGANEGFGDMHIMGLSKRNERFSPEAVVQALPDLGGMLQIPQAVGNMNQNQLRTIFVNAAQQAIYEIIAPVVERSVTIAAISTAELIQKDFATEADIEKLRNSAHTVVKALSGSLALVTCKEPLRMSIMNNIRILASRHLPEQLPEGQILMFVNDNIETVCSLVESAAEEHSVAEIDAQLAQAISDRTQHGERRPNEGYNNPQVSRWARLIPDPYRQDPEGVNANGLNRQQLALYEDFGRQARIPSHGGTASVDARGQLPQDVLSDTYLPNIPTPAEVPAIPRQTPQQQQRVPGMQSVNGFLDPREFGAKVLELMGDLHQAVHSTPEDRVSELPEASPIRRIYAQLIDIAASVLPRDDLVAGLAQRCFSTIYDEAEKRLEVEVLVRVIAHICKISPQTGRTVTAYLSSTEDENKLSNAAATSAFLAEGLIDVQQLDVSIYKALKARHEPVFTFARDLLDDVLLGNNPIALRADFVQTFDALAQWLAEEPDLHPIKELLERLRTSGLNSLPSPPESEKQDQYEYIFDEWTRLQRREKDLPGRAVIAFLQQLEQKEVIGSAQSALEFYKVCLEVSCAHFDQATHAPYPPDKDEAYLRIDAFAKLVSSLVLFQSPGDGAVNKKAAMLDQVCRWVILVIAKERNELRERFHGKVYFRLFSSMLCELYSNRAHFQGQEMQIYQVFATALEILQPVHFDCFAYQWLALLSHRITTTALLGAGARAKGGWTSYSRLLTILMTNLERMFAVAEGSQVWQEFYRGAMRLFLMLHHDFPDFLVERATYLNSCLPPTSGQLHNLINSAVPRAAMAAQPDPFTPGLKVNRLDMVRTPPAMPTDIADTLDEAGIGSTLQRVCSSTSHELAEEEYASITSALEGQQGRKKDLIANTIIAYIAMQATKASSAFSSAAAPARLLQKLVTESQAPTQYCLVSAMLNQVRFVSSHTQYFITGIQHIFANGSPDLQQLIMRVIVERLGVPRPHPWGIIVMVLDMLKSTSYDLWTLPWMDSIPQVRGMLMNLAQQSERSTTTPL